MKKIIITTAFSTLVISGCVPKPLTLDSYGAAYYVRTGIISDNVAEAHSMAVIHCSKYGKTAAFSNIETNITSQPSSKAIAKFDCK